MKLREKPNDEYLAIGETSRRGKDWYGEELELLT